MTAYITICDVCEYKRTCSVIRTLSCFAVIGVAVTLVAFVVRGCQPDPVYVADSICEQCGAIITDADHGRCQTAEVAYGK